MLTRYRRSLSLKLTSLLLASCLLIAMALAGLTVWTMRRDTLNDLSATTTTARDRAVLVLDGIKRRMLSHSDLVAENPALAVAITKNDKGELRARLVKMFEEVRKADPAVASLEVTDAKGVVLMRGHRPESNGDAKGNDPLVREALRGQGGTGFSVSASSGEVGADAVVPIRIDGAVVGSVKVGSYLRVDMARELKALSGSEIVFVRGDKVNASTIKGLDMLPPGAAAEVELLDVGGVRYSVARYRIPTANNEQVDVVSLTDTGPAMDNVNRFMAAFLMKAGLVVLLLVPAVVLLMRRLASAVHDVTVSMSAVADGDLQAQVRHLDREDEVGAMARVVEVFREKSARMRELEEQERAVAADRVARAQAMTAVVNDVSQVVAEAAAGNFSARLRVDSDDADMQKLAAGINEINTVVDRATTEFAEVLERVAQGDLTQAVSTAYTGRFADLKSAINSTIERLSETVETIQTAATDVGGAAREINAGADNLSRRTEEQAASLEETAATTEQLAASVKASAQSSRQAVDLAEQATKVAETGGAIVTQAVEAMSRIEQTSQKISDITSVIDEIAFQTNLLALNAAVEAARAGDAGKGFAVVASEVRTLAQRSGEAARDITGLIQASTSEVTQGVKLVRSAGEALDQIVGASRRVSSTVGEISTATAEQANGIDEMSQVVAQMDEMTQQNAALAEESSASASSLASQIDQLNTIVATFRTRSGAPKSRAVPARAPTSADAGEPARLRRLAEEAFNGDAPRAKPPAGRPARVQPQPVAAKKVVGGWDEF